MFVKYRQSVNDPAVSVFQRILIYLPIIDIHKNLDDVINYEMRIEEGRKNPDYDKLQTIELFKKYKQNYMFIHKKKNVNFDDPGAEKAAEKEVENKFLEYLEEMLKDSYQNMKNHEERLQ